MGSDVPEGADIREEAERLVSAALAAASYALRGVGRDSPLAGLADRVLSPEFAFRVAMGANDIASGVASILRAFQPAPPRPQPSPRPRDPGPTWRAATDHPPVPADPSDDPWHAATTQTPPSDGESG